MTDAIRIGPITAVGDFPLALSPDGQLHELRPPTAAIRGWPTVSVLATPLGRVAFSELEPDLDAHQLAQLRTLGVEPLAWVPEGDDRDRAAPLRGEIIGEGSAELKAATLAMGAQDYGYADFMVVPGIVVVNDQAWDVFIECEDVGTDWSYTVVLTPREAG
jgi:hypothetical protein